MGFIKFSYSTCEFTKPLAKLLINHGWRLKALNKDMLLDVNVSEAVLYDL